MSKSLPDQSVPLYRTIVADPPWAVRQPPKTFKTSGNAPLPYPTMTLDAIKALPVAPFATDDAHLYLWTTNSFVREVYGVAEAWGFRPSMLLTWCKAPLGIGPGWEFASATEFVLFARRGKATFGQRPKAESRNWWEWKRGRHSEKPGPFFDLVERVSPGPYLELFARTKRLGWDAWGNEIDSDVEMAA